MKIRILASLLVAAAYGLVACETADPRQVSFGVEPVEIEEELDPAGPVTADVQQNILFVTALFERHCAEDGFDWDYDFTAGQLSLTVLGVPTQDECSEVDVYGQYLFQLWPVQAGQLDVTVTHERDAARDDGVVLDTTLLVQ